MFKVGLFCDSFYPMVDGVVKCVESYAKILTRDGFDVTVFVPKPRDKSYVDNFTFAVKRCKIMKVFFLDYDLPLPMFDRAFKKALDQAKLDIIHVHSPFTIGKMALKYAKKHKIPSFITFHSQFKLDFQRAVKFKPLVNLMMRRIMKVFNSADVCLTMNEFARDLVKEYGCKIPVRLLPNATDFCADRPKEEYVSFANKTWGLGEKDFVLLYLGRINKLKNVDFIVEALKLLPKELNYKMVFAGGGKDKQAIEKEVQKSGLSDKVVFTGKLLDPKFVKAIYARCDLFLIPSRYDTDAIVKIEAAYFEKPSVCLKGTGAGSAITDNVNGFLIDEDAAQFADLIVKLKNNPQLLKTVGVQAKADLYITWDEVVKRLENIYKESKTNANAKTVQKG